MGVGSRGCVIPILLLLLSAGFVSIQVWIQKVPRCDPVPAQSHSRTFATSKLTVPVQLTEPEQPQHWNVSSEDKLLVIVIAGGSRGLVYPSYRSIWTAVAERVASIGVHVYLVSMDPSINSTILSNHQLVFPGIDSLVPGVLNETLLALDYVHGHKLPGSKAPYTLRTNLSSFWQFNKLLAWLWDNAIVLAGMLGVGNFPSGAGTVMNASVCERLRTLPRAKLLNTTAADDVAIGDALQPFFNATPMARRDFLGGGAAPEDLSSTYFHYRIKSGDELRDIGIMHMFFATWYEEGKISAARTNQWQQVSVSVKG